MSALPVMAFFFLGIYGKVVWLVIALTALGMYIGQKRRIVRGVRLLHRSFPKNNK
jgi:heme exporter protein D